MKISILQIPVLESFGKNLDWVRAQIPALKEICPDFILLPECWNTPYENERIKEASQWDHLSRQVLMQLASEVQAYVIGGTIPWQNGSRIYNRCFVFDRQGKEMGFYDKTHLMEVYTCRSSYREQDVFTPGDTLKLFETEFGLIGVVVCYDIRFCEPARILAQAGIQLLFVPAAFNARVGPRHWQPLLQTRAMENEIFVIGCNPAARQYKTYASYGRSMICDPDGQIAAMADEGPAILTAQIDLDQIQRQRSRMPFWKVRRNDLYLCKTREDVCDGPGRNPAEPDLSGF